LREELITRLKRVEGQARGVQKMIMDGRPCEEILIQIAALKAGATQVAAHILVQYMEKCLTEGDEGTASLETSRDELAKLFGKLL
jgi:DNA-binding FrmR family transcriptional regulator